MSPNLSFVSYMTVAVLAVAAAGQILRSNGRTLLVSACPEGNLPGAEAAMRLIVAVYHLFGFGFVFLIGSTGNSPAGRSSVLEVFAVKLGSASILLGIVCGCSALAIQAVINRATSQAAKAA